MIKIKRSSAYTDRLRAYKVVLDGATIGEVRDGQQIELDVPPGKHTLHLKIDWCRSNEVDFVAANSTINFECGSNVDGYKRILGLLYITFLRSQYIWLRTK